MALAESSYPEGREIKDSYRYKGQILVAVIKIADSSVAPKQNINPS